MEHGGQALTTVGESEGASHEAPCMAIIIEAMKAAAVQERDLAHPDFPPYDLHQKIGSRCVFNVTQALRTESAKRTEENLPSFHVSRPDLDGQARIQCHADGATVPFFFIISSGTSLPHNRMRTPGKGPRSAESADGNAIRVRQLSLWEDENSLPEAQLSFWFLWNLFGSTFTITAALPVEMKANGTVFECHKREIVYSGNPFVQNPEPVDLPDEVVVDVPFAEKEDQTQPDFAHLG